MANATQTDQVEKECVKSGAEADRRQYAKANPVRAPYKLLVKHGNILHTTHARHSV